MGHFVAARRAHQKDEIEYFNSEVNTTDEGRQKTMQRTFFRRLCRKGRQSSPDRPPAVNAVRRAIHHCRVPGSQERHPLRDLRGRFTSKPGRTREALDSIRCPRYGRPQRAALFRAVVHPPFLSESFLRNGPPRHKRLGGGDGDPSAGMNATYVSIILHRPGQDPPCWSQSYLSPTSSVVMGLWRSFFYNVPASVSSGMSPKMGVYTCSGATELTRTPDSAPCPQKQQRVQEMFHVPTL